MEPYSKPFSHDLEEAIDIGPSNALGISRLNQQIDARLNNQIERLIDRNPDRSVSVIRRWLSEGR